LHGRTRVEAWKSLARAQRWQEFVEAMLEAHYDPAYERSMRRNYAQIDSSADLELDDRPNAIDRAAAALATARVAKDGVV